MIQDPINNCIKVFEKDSGINICDLDFKEFHIECRRIFKIFINNNERTEKFGINNNFVVDEERLKLKQEQFKVEAKKEREKLETIKDTLRTSIKLRAKLKSQSELLYEVEEINTDLVLETLKKFVTVD